MTVKQARTAFALHFAGLLLCILPPALAVLEYFPLFKGEPKKQISAGGILLLCLCCIPLWRSIKAFLRSASAWKLWLVVLVFCILANAVVDELLVIAAIGLPSGILGAGVFALERRYRRRHEGGEP